MHIKRVTHRWPADSTCCVYTNYAYNQNMNENKRIQYEVSRDAKLLGLAAGNFMAERDIDGVDVAKRIGRSNSYVSERVTGLRFIDSQVLQGIADCAGIGLHSLMMELSTRAARMGASE